MNAIETRDLTYRFSPTDTILRDVDLTVPTGSIYGFLGPNGAGKTTTLRLLLGLLQRQQGSIRVFDLPLEAHRVEILRRIGSSIESPSLYTHLTARENLAIWQTVFGCPDRRIDDVLHRVGLAHTGSKRTGQFSLGMKQRLSIAIALLHEPDLLILDEPTNGLDPHGIIEIRDLLHTLNREHNTTIVVSSHLLTEVERLITYVGIIHRGALMFQGPLSTLMKMQQEGGHTLLDTSDNSLALDVITTGGWSARIERDKILIPSLSRSDAAWINNQLMQRGISVHEIAPEKKDLEQIFLKLIQD